MPTITGTSGNDTLTGGAENDTIQGLDGDDELSGNAGNDNLAGGSGNDTLNGGDGHDTVNGDAGNDYLTGGEGHDWLDGGPGADIMRGGPGNDQYTVDDPGDAVEEVHEPGSYDRVYSSISYVLPGEIENLSLTGNAAIDGTGNGLDNLVLGNAGNNILSGGAGNDDLRAEGGDDQLFGGAGSDSLWAGAGNDILDGGEGGDSMGGGPGDDLYVVDSNGDSVSEAAGSGIDSVQASNAYHLPDNVENLTITITSNANTQYGGMGNASANIMIGIGAAFQFHGLGGDDRLYGAAGADFLNGGAGADIIEGGDGGDIYWIDLVGDHVAAEFFDRGSSGLDEVRVASYAGGTVTLFAGDIGLERISLLDTSALNINASAVLNPMEVYGNMFANQLKGTDFADQIGGGGGADILTGGLGADALMGGPGWDRFLDTAAGLNGDSIWDFAAGDRIVISDASMGSFSFSLAGDVLTYTGGTLTLGSFSGKLQASSVASGGVQLTVVGAPTPSSDFNGDGHSDLVWRHADGTFLTWMGQPGGAFVANPASGANALGADWRVAGVGDFNGDGKDDILWRHSSGEIGEWLGQSSGPFVNNGGAAANAVDNSWSVVGVADYNGDGRDDILWRHASGEVGQWVGLPSGGFANNGGAAANAVDPSWTVVANGDFNGDNRADVLWRHSSGVFAEWQGTASGRLVNSGGVMTGATGSVVGSGDFNGDGRDDVLTRSASGGITGWLGQATGQFTSFTPAQQVNDLNWKIASIGDFNGDGNDDLLWRHSSGAGAEWLSTGSGDFAYNGPVPSMDASWQIQSPDIHLG